jgi:hypothetical protein
MAALRPAALEDALGGLSPESRHAAVLSVDGVRGVLNSLGALRAEH